MASIVTALRELAWLRKHAALREEVPHLHWARVTSVVPLTVVIDGDETAEPRQVRGNAAGPVTVGQRVRVEKTGTTIVILAAPRPAPEPPAPWVTPTLLNGWEHYSAPGGSFARVAYKRVDGGWLLRGLIRNGTAGQAAFTIPNSGVTATLVMHTISGGQLCDIRVTDAGEVQPTTGALPGVWVSLSGLLIPTD